MTYRFAVLGDPISHSRSPEIHRAMAALVGLDVQYDRVRADRDTLLETIAGLRAGEWDGLNVTMPLKEDAASLADAMSPQVARSGSANTLVTNDAGVYAHSTDSIAVGQVVSEPEFADVAGYLVLGAGGSAKAILAGLDDRLPVYVSARRPERAEELTRSLGGDTVRWGAAVSNAMVLNATPIGMKGEALPAGIVDVASGLVDLPYASGTTPAVRLARDRGIPVIDGLEFLLRQALESFRIWTGTAPELADVVARMENV